MEYVLTDFRCKYCGSQNIVKYGTSGGTQYWWCKDCKRKFADNDAIAGMKTPFRQVSSALGMYYRGLSIDEIRQQLVQQDIIIFHNHNLYMHLRVVLLQKSISLTGFFYLSLAQ